MKTWKLFFLSVLGFLQFGRQVIRYALIFLSAFLRSRSSLGCELVAIRSQLTFYKESIRQKKQSRPRFTPAFRLLWVLLSRVWSGWKSAADLMKPKTVLQLSTRKTLRKADSGATGQHHSRTASVCETAVLQLKVSSRRTFVQQSHFVSFLFACDCPPGKGIRLPLERSGDAVHRQPESKPGGLLRPRVRVWRREKVDGRLILDVGGPDGNTPRCIPSAVVSDVLH
jgi:hypothetical protein